MGSNTQPTDTFCSTKTDQCGYNGRSQVETIISNFFIIFQISSPVILVTDTYNGLFWIYENDYVN